MIFQVRMRTRANGAEGRDVTHSGTVDAHSILNAVGQACLQFHVRTDEIVGLEVDLVDEGDVANKAQPKT